MNFTQCREKCGHAIRDATSSLEARKKRKLEREKARKNVDSAVFAAENHLSYLSPWDQRAWGSSLYQPNLDNLFVGNNSFEGINPFLAGQILSKNLEELTSRRISSVANFRPALDRQSDSVLQTPDHVWRSAVSETSRTKRSFESNEVDKIGDEFLAYIDDALGPLPADAEMNLVSLTSTATGDTRRENYSLGEREGKIRSKGRSVSVTQSGRDRLGERLNSRWFPNLGATRPESKRQDDDADRYRHET